MTTIRTLIFLSLITTLLTSCDFQTTEQYKQKVVMKNYFDSTGEIFIKLYKRTTANKILYWETWNTNNTSATTHWGEVGEKGDTKVVSDSTSKEFQNRINSIIEDKIKEGYSEIPVEDQFTVIITFKLKAWGTTKDLERREEVRNIVTENVGWTGNGRCDDGDIGSGEMILYADVVDPYIAIKTLSKEFVEKSITDEHRFGIMKGDSVIAADYKANEE